MKSTFKENIDSDEPLKNLEDFFSCNFEDSFEKDFADLNSDHANLMDKNHADNMKNKPKASDKIYEIQKIILMLRVFNLKLHIQKFRDNKIESKDSVYNF